MADMLGIDRRIDKVNPQYLNLKKGIIPNNLNANTVRGVREIKDARLAILLGVYEQGWKNKESFPEVDMSVSGWWRYKSVLGELEDKKEGYEKSLFNCSKYKFFLGADFNISAKCCSVMKKNPVHKYAKESGRKPMTAQMASESRLRSQQWLKNGCNGFEMKSPISNPMSFWTEQDVLLYIKEKNLPIASVYGEIVYDNSGNDNFDGQLKFGDIEEWKDYGIFDNERPLLKTTGCNRTGCMFCGYGCHLEKGEGRFERMKRTHPKQYEYIMKPWSEGGLDYKRIIDWINEHGNLNIKY